MIVCKFGGTSVKDSESILKVLGIVKEKKEKGLILVSSAMGKSTDRILELIETASKGEKNELKEMIKSFESDFYNQMNKLIFNSSLKDQVEEKCSLVFEEFRSLLKGISLLQNCSARTKDALLSTGERLSTLLIWGSAKQLNLNCRWYDIRNVIKTDSQFGMAEVDYSVSNPLIKEQIKPETGEIIITQGFIASNQSGITTTLGRGGSDLSAAIIGAALDVKAIEIWTDVNGIMTSDPRTIKGVKTIREISYAEAGELAYFGARVLHPSTLQPAVTKKIPVYVKNTHEMNHPGTLIAPYNEKVGLKAIAGKKGITLIQINSSRMLNAYGFLKKIFTIFDHYQTPVDLVSTSEVSLSLTIDNAEAINEIEKELSTIGQVKIEYKKAILSLVGRDLWKRPAFLSEVFSELKGIPLSMISLGSSDINLSMVLDEKYLNQAIQRLHDTHLKS